jgi:KUP system potassium uptake protein
MSGLLLRDGEPPVLNPRLAIVVAAVGVVFGDIGTSPLYALRACFVAAAGIPLNDAAVFGVLSLIFWALALIISVKYVGIVLRADNDGEGGVLALTTLVLKDKERAQERAKLIGLIGLAGCALFYGDGVITPAVTVLGALEGLAVAAPSLERFVVPLSLIVLLWLFSFQKRGTGAIGRLFGPFMLVWFITLAALGLRMIITNPSILMAANPFYAIQFLGAHAAVGFAVVGAVFLVVTGGEALYADLGHFGRTPIARAWFVLVWPCLLLNYFGQGALLLAQPAAVANPFYLLAPAWAVVPLLLLATAASVIASQAVISGVFAITQQCQQLGLIPRLRIHYSSSESIGQVYVPAVNWLLCVTTLALVIGFRSSEAIAHAYGVGVSFTMLIDSLLMILLFLGLAQTRARTSLAVMCVVLAIDLAFVAANLLKVPTGGWFPLLFGLLVFWLMRTWQIGRVIVTDRMRREERTVESFIEFLSTTPPVRVPGLAVFLTSSTRGIPRTLVRNVKLNGVLREHTVLLTVATERIPRLLRGSRIQIEQVVPGVVRVIARVGFMEMPNVPKLLQEAERAGLGARTEDAVYFVGHDDIVLSDAPGMWRWRKLVFLFLAHNSQFAGTSFGIPPTRLMEVGGQVEI